MHAALLRSGMPLVRVPRAVFELLDGAASACGISLRRADPRTVRSWLLASASRQSGLSRAEGLALLHHCLSDYGASGGASAADVGGLQLVPMVDGSWGRIEHLVPTRFVHQRVILQGLSGR